MLSTPAFGFTVVKNVNSGKPPVDKIVVFEKGKPVDQLTLESADASKAEFNKDGSLESKFIGDGEVKVILRWKPGSGIPAVLDLSKYNYVVATLRLEGGVKNKQPDGKMVPQPRAGNLWFGLTLFNGAGESAGSANLADAAEDGKTPEQTVTLKIPMCLFTFWMNDIQHVQGFGFVWGKMRPGSERDFRLVVDKIALAD